MDGDRLITLWFLLQYVYVQMQPEPYMTAILQDGAAAITGDNGDPVTSLSNDGHATVKLLSMWISTRLTYMSHPLRNHFE